MPVFMKAGCNTGSCHGAARGKDGFRLSLFGFDPDGDYYRLTREQPERRLDLSIPSRVPAHRKSHRPGAAHRRQPHQERRSVSTKRCCAGWKAARRPTPATVPTVDARRALSASRAARWRGRNAAAHRAGEVLRRHRPRRHQPRRLPVEQRQRGGRVARRQSDGRQSRRGLHHGPLRKAHRRRAVHRAAEGPRVSMAGNAGKQLHRRAGVRQAAHGCGFSRPSCAPMRSSFAA